LFSNLILFRYLDRMEVKLSHVERIVEMLSERTGQPLDLRGFGEMSSVIGTEKISKKYLYENLHLHKEKAKKRNLHSLNLQITKLDVIAKFLQYRNFRMLVEDLEKPISNILLGCVGNYYNYVRRNSKDTVVFRSPVKIYREGAKFWFELRGPSSQYKGELHLSEGCIFVVMEAANGKIIHHIYRIGKVVAPKVMQGIFSGVSTTFDPIGGRTVLVRIDEVFDQLKNQALKPSELKASTMAHEKRLVNYFTDRDKNNLSVSSVGSTFTIDDL
jgi:hypothetical protein